jgi:tetratricopeptide (TPR) repeat protein
MKKTTLSVFALLLTIWTFGQININDLKRTKGIWKKKGEKTGFTGSFVEYFDNGKIKGKGDFKNGLLEGQRIMYYENGQIMMVSIYSIGLNNGKSTEFYENGKVKQEGDLKNGLEEGIWNLYYENGTKKTIFTFLNGIQHGDYFDYLSDGKLNVQYYYTNGKAGYAPDFILLTDQAIALSQKFKNKEAIKLYEKAIEMNPTVAQVYFNRGTCKSNSLNAKGAIADYDKAIELNPKYMEAYGNRGNAKINLLTAKGNINLTLEETASACEDFKKAVSLGDKSQETTDMIFLYCQKQ